MALRNKIYATVGLFYWRIRMDLIHNFTDDIIQFGLLIVGLITFYIMLKRDNRKALLDGRA